MPRRITPENSPTTHAVIGAAMDVHRHLGHGFMERIYQEALQIELVARNIPFEREKLLPVHYKGQVLGRHFRADFLVDGVVVELKASANLHPSAEAQVLHYLRAARRPVGLLLNFGESSLVVRRFVNGLDEADLASTCDDDETPVSAVSAQSAADGQRVASATNP